jgi:UDP-N-acetylglucosamine--N-acetylmuramyl-(pentapeptide) pyrophosphoryl-undecaprenol N-acetylglucosamine transferase
MTTRRQRPFPGQRCGAFLLPQTELTPDSIALIRNYGRSQLLEMAEKARSQAKPDAAEAVAQLCMDIAK